MSKNLKKVKALYLLGGLFLISIFSLATTEAPMIQTPPPVIFLADNLDEEDNLGWCIDTVGRGFAETLHAHSCKPQGGDVQFKYDQETLAIQSATFENKCVTIDDLTQEQSDSEENSIKFLLLDCTDEDTRQQIVYDEEAQNFYPKDSPELCLSVGESSRAAGPYMSRSLQLVICAETEEALWQWVVLTK